MVRYLFLLVLLLPLPSLAEECPRIISQSPYITHTLEWMGLKDCIVGTSRYDKLGLATTGGVYDPDAEAIDDLMPDIIFTSTWTKPEVLKSVTPKDAKAYRLHGFQSMAQIEDNLRTIAEAVGLKNPAAHAERFHRLLQERLAQLHGDNRKVLLLSACSGNPYSFGKATWLYDLFTQAGFRVVGTHDNIHHIQADKLGGFIDSLQPELVFVFERKAAKQCRLITPKTPVRIVPLDGDTLLHPAPILLEGLDEVIGKQSIWKRI